MGESIMADILHANLNIVSDIADEIGIDKDICGSALTEMLVNYVSLQNEKEQMVAEGVLETDAIKLLCRSCFKQIFSGVYLIEQMFPNEPKILKAKLALAEYARMMIQDADSPIPSVQKNIVSNNTEILKENNVEEDKNDQSGWWRWLLLPFASVIGATLVSMLILILHSMAMKMYGFDINGWYHLYGKPILSGAGFGWCYVIITLATAPKRKIIAAVTMTTILGVVYLIGGVLMWFYPIVEPEESDVYSIISGISTMIAAISTLVKNTILFNKDE